MAQVLTTTARGRYGLLQEDGQVLDAEADNAATGSSTTALGPPVTDFGVIADAITLQDVSVTGNAWHSPSAQLTSADLGKTTITVGADVGGKQLCTTFASIVGPHDATLATPATINVVAVNGAYGTDNGPALQAFQSSKPSGWFPPGAYMFGTGVHWTSRFFGNGQATLIFALPSGLLDTHGVGLLALPTIGPAISLAATVQPGATAIQINGVVASGNRIVLAKLGGSLQAQSFTVLGIAGAAPQTVTLDRGALATYVAGTASVDVATNFADNMVLSGFVLQGRSVAAIYLGASHGVLLDDCRYDGTLGDAEQHWVLTASGCYDHVYSRQKFGNGVNVVGIGIASIEASYLTDFEYIGTNNTSPAAANYHGAFDCHMLTFSVAGCATGLSSSDSVGCSFQHGSVSKCTTNGIFITDGIAPLVNDVEVAGAMTSHVNVQNTGVIGLRGRNLYLVGGINGGTMLSDGGVSSEWAGVICVPNSANAADVFKAIALVGGGATIARGLYVLANDPGTGTAGTGRCVGLTIADVQAAHGSFDVAQYQIQGLGDQAALSFSESGSGIARLIMRDGDLISAATGVNIAIFGGGTVRFRDTRLVNGRTAGSVTNAIIEDVETTTPVVRHSGLSFVGTITNHFNISGGAQDNSMGQGLDVVRTVTLNGVTGVVDAFPLEFGEQGTVAYVVSLNGATSQQDPIGSPTFGTSFTWSSVAGDTRIVAVRYT